MARSLSQSLMLCALICLGVVAAAQAFTCPKTGPNGTYLLDPLSLPYDGYLPLANNETMFLHHDKHHQAYITNVNALITKYPVLNKYGLASLVVAVGTPKFLESTGIPANDTFLLRNNAGGHYNHAMFWKTLTTAGASNPASDLSTELQTLINTAFGSVDSLTTAMRTAGSSVFGSGWAWLCYAQSTASLKVITTPNQDNPLMKQYAKAAACIPILGVDVWEHAYYLTFRNVRANYLAAWVQNINWAQVEKNYQFAKAGEAGAIWCATEPASV